MQLVWRVTTRDAAEIRKFVESRRGDPFVRRRIARNVRGERPALDVRRFWQGLLVGLITTQQRSGPSSTVGQFLSLKPFPLSYGRCRSARNAEHLALRSLRAHGGIRRIETLADQIAINLGYLRAGGWKELLPQLRPLEKPHRRVAEQRTADQLASVFKGIGPKQSRNVLQFLGLTRYEIPIDSRLTAWLNDFGFPLHLSAQALSDPHYYAFVSAGVQALCKRAGILPCVLDAAIFASFDKEEWPEGSVAW